VEALSRIPGDLLKYYIDGGLVMHFISVLSLFSLTAIVYKLFVFRRVKLNATEFIAKVRSALLKGDVNGAMKVCEQSRSPVASITKSALLKYDQPREQMEKAMENAAIHEVAYL
jgi:biopolymer transport protein ExbB